MIIRLLEPKDASQIAKIHRQAIHAGFMASLSPAFLESFYKVIPRSKNAFGFVGEKEGVVCGFICVAKDTKKLFKELILKWGIVLGLPLLRYVFNFSVVKKIFNSLFYNKVVKELPKAEILSVAVDVNVQGQNLGSKLMAVTIQELKNQQVLQIKVLTDADNKGSNLYYKKHGFVLSGKVSRHNRFLNIYQARFT